MDSSDLVRKIHRERLETSLRTLEAFFNAQYYEYDPEEAQCLIDSLVRDLKEYLADSSD